MVGVAGRSKGCSTCRKRKKGCDLARPQCGQCVKSGKVCGGYERDLTFIHHKASAQPSPVRSDSDKSTESSRSSSEQPSQQSAQSFAWLDEYPSFDAEFPSFDSELEPEAELSSLALVKAYAREKPQDLPPSLARAALTTLHIDLFNSFYLPRTAFGPNSLVLRVGSARLWTHAIPPIVNNDSSLQLAFLALSSSRIGYDSNDPCLLSVGKQLYGKALREMGRALMDPTRRCTDEALMACSTLGLYEIFEAQTTSALEQKAVVNGWLSHSAAVTRLLELRGPEAYIGQSHTVFLHCRITTAIRAATAQKTTFLSRPEWMTIPWLKYPKTLQDQLIDIMVFVPTVLEAYNYIEKSREPQAEHIRRRTKGLLVRCQQLSKELEQWYEKMCTSANLEPLWHSVPSTDQSYPFEHYTFFDDHTLAYTIVLYWTNCLIILGIQRQLEESLGEIPFFEGTQSPLKVNARTYAFNIAQALPYFLRPEMGALGPNMILFPVGMVIAYFVKPARPVFAADLKAMQSGGLLIDRIMQGNFPPEPEQDLMRAIHSWFSGLFADLSARGMPGGLFLSGLMRAAVTEGINSVFDFKKSS